MVKIGLIGAGAIAQHAYLPALRKGRLMNLKAVVDTDPRITASLSEEFSLAYAGCDLAEALKYLDAVIVCVPNHLHHFVAKFCLERGKHVLCEKPVCTKSAAAEDLIQTARSNALVFTVAHVRRFYPAIREIKRIIVEQEFGPLRKFDFREGTVFSWPSVTGFAFDKEKSGGGVLMDIGVHLLDILFWWTGTELCSFQYADDSFGGVEATSEIQIKFHGGVEGQVKLTRLGVLKNFYTLYFERGTLSWNPFMPQRIYIQKDKKISSRKMPGENSIQAMLRDFAGAVLEHRPSLVRGEEALASLRFIESCYAQRQDIPMPWMRMRDSI